MTARWRNGISLFVGFIILAIILRMAILWFVSRDFAHLFDIEALGVSIMIAFFVSLGLSSRQ